MRGLTGSRLEIDSPSSILEGEIMKSIGAKV